MNDFEKELEKLNPEQLGAVVYNEGPLRIIAGAGSGKTRVITMKIAYLVNVLKVPSWRILALTFTNKAAKEMRDRVESILGNDKKINPFISTFHSFCYRVLREDGVEIGLAKNFSIIDTADQKNIVRKAIKDQGIDKKNYSRAEAKALGAIEEWKVNFIDPPEALEKAVEPEEKDYALVYEIYAKYLKDNNYVDFNDLQLKTYLLFSNNSEVRDKWTNRFDYVMVDEFQDTNELQSSLIKLLNNKSNKLTVVGDPDQTIYTWRGAKVEIILDFEKNFPGAKTIILDRNYRSTKPILTLANDLIDNNINRQKKDIYTDVDGAAVIVHESISQEAEADYVTKTILQLVKDGEYDYSDFFVLYRINAWSREFENAFENVHIPYQLIGGIRFRDRKVIKDATAFLKAVALEDNISLERILRTTPKIGEVTINKLVNYSTVNDMSIFTLLTNFPEEAKAISKHLEPIGQLLKDGQTKLKANLPPADLLKFLLTQSGFEDRVRVLAKEDEEELQYLNAFYDQLTDFHIKFDPEFYNENNETQAFLQEEALGDGENEGVANKVTLLTVHASKGLENKVVFVTGLSSGIFPSYRSKFSAAELEEERRAMYVAMTRAEKRLYLTYINGGYSHIVQQALSPSKFIKELNPDLYTLEQTIAAPLINSYERSFLNKTLSKEVIEQTKYQVHDVVNHVMFGDGVVVKVLDNNQLQIAFNNPSYGVRVVPINSSAIKKIN